MHLVYRSSMVGASSGNLFAPNNFMSVDDTPLLMGAIYDRDRNVRQGVYYA